MTKPLGSTIFRNLNFGYSVFLVADEQLRVDDKVSLIFLLFEDLTEALNKATLVIEASNTSYQDILVIWTKSCGLLWRQKFLEALIIIKSFDIINQILDLDLQTIDRYYPMNSFQTAFVHPMKKLLYTISEALVREETNQIIIEIQNIFYSEEPMIIEEKDIHFFEVFLLKLIKRGFMELGTWDCKPMIIPPFLKKASVQGFMFILIHFNFSELHDLLSAIESKFNKLVSESRQPSRGFEFEEDQEIMAARLNFNSWIEKGLTKLRSSSRKDEGEPMPCSSHTQKISHVEEEELTSETQDINNESQNNDDVIEELMHSLNGVDLSESTNRNLTMGERLQRADVFQQFNEPMDLVEELGNMNLGSENLNDLIQVPSTCLARGESYSIATHFPKMYLFNNCFVYENEDDPSRVEFYKERSNALLEEEFVTRAFQSLHFQDFVMQQTNHDEIEDVFGVIDKFKENPSMLVFFMVCYGLNGCMVNPNGELVKREYLERLLMKIPQLVGKPKILIVQTYILDNVRLPEQSTECRTDLTDLFSMWVAIPYDMHKGGGCYPFNSEIPGVSMFLKTFCDHLEVMDSNKDFVSVCHDVCVELLEKTNGMLTPKYDSYLSKLLYIK